MAFAVYHHLALQTILGLIPGFFCGQAQVPRNGKRNQDKSDVTHKSLVDTTPAGRQPSELFGVSEERFDDPAALLAEHGRGGIDVQVSCCQYLDISVAFLVMTNLRVPYLGR